MSQEKEGMYKLGTKHGTLNQLCARNHFTLCKETFINVNDVPEHEITIRECAMKESHLGGEGFQHCNCTGDCGSKSAKNPSFCVTQNDIEVLLVKTNSSSFNL
nr:unnamed protein product [Callosobruchus analis]